MLSEIEKAYFAGLFDGEGWISLHRSLCKSSANKNPTYHIDVGISMTSITPLLKLKEEYNGSIHNRKLRKGQNYPIYDWKLSTNASLIFLKDMEKLLIIKKDQALWVIDFAKKCSFDRGRKITPEVNALREYYYLQMRELRKDRK